MGKPSRGGNVVKGLSTSGDPVSTPGVSLLENNRFGALASSAPYQDEEGNGKPEKEYENKIIPWDPPLVQLIPKALNKGKTRNESESKEVSNGKEGQGRNLEGKNT
jgi:hypothetical protein